MKITMKSSDILTESAFKEIFAWKKGRWVADKVFELLLLYIVFYVYLSTEIKKKKKKRNLIYKDRRWKVASLKPCLYYHTKFINFGLYFPKSKKKQTKKNHKKRMKIKKRRKKSCLCYTI